MSTSKKVNQKAKTSASSENHEVKKDAKVSAKKPAKKAPEVKKTNSSTPAPKELFATPAKSADNKPVNKLTPEEIAARKPGAKKSAKKGVIAGIAAAFVVAILAVVGIIAAPNFFKKEEPAEEPEVAEQTEPEEEQKEEEPEEEKKEEEPAPAPVNNTRPAANTQTSANLPVYMSIPSLGIYSNVIAVGKNGSAMAVPANERVIGWYNQSNLPGSNGVTIYTAHGGNLGNGIFKTLPGIQRGATITVRMGDGRQYTYEVVETATRAAGAAANQYMPTIFNRYNGQPTLSIITCTGQWIRAEQAYNQRFFLRAVLKN